MPSLEEMILAQKPSDAPKEDQTPPEPPEEKDDDAPAPEEPEAPATEDSPPAEEDKPEDAEDPSAIRNYAKDLLGDDARAWIDTFKDDDAFLKGVHEAQKLIGRRHEDSAVVKWMQDNGVTAADLEQIIAARNNPQPTDSSPRPAADEWNPKWVNVDAKGNWIPTASAPSDITARIERYRARIAEALADPAKLAEMVLPHLDQQLDSERKKLQTQLTQRDEKRAFEAWSDQKRALLFVGESDELTDLGKMVNDRLASGKINRELGWVDQANDALEWAIAKSQPRPTTKPSPAKAKHQTAPATGPARKLTDAEFFKKYGTGLEQWVTYQTTGELPAVA